MMMAMATETRAIDEHPRLLVRSDQYDQLRRRAHTEPWRNMQEGVRSCTSLVYTPDASIYAQYSSITAVMRQAALAVILYPQDRQRYVSHIVDQLAHWDDLNVVRRQRPKADWDSMISGGDAFFTSILALDIIHDDLTAAQLATIEARLQTWYEYERDVSSGSWYLAKYGAMGLWALYLNDHDAFESHARAYDRRLRQHVTDDGVALVGGNYASARLAGGELAKTYFMDVLTIHGWHDYYADPMMGAFYEWFYAGMLTPTKHFTIFQDCRELAHSGTQGMIANHRAHRFSRKAAEHAAWLQPRPPTPGLLGYVLIDKALPAPRPPQSHLWMSGYAALWEDDTEDALMAALWSTNRAFHHDHYEINAIHLTGYGQTLLRNTGYEGWGNAAAEFSWPYLSRFDIRPEWDYAVGGNIAYLDRDEPHVSKTGGGLQEGILQPAVDYVAGDAAAAVKGGHHVRSVVLVKDRESDTRPYFLLIDEITLAAAEGSVAGDADGDAAGTTLADTLKDVDASPTPLRLALHPASNHDQVVTPGTHYRWGFDDDLFLTIFVATPTGEGTRLKRGGLSQFEQAPMYLHAEFDFDAESTQALTVLFPHEGVASAPQMSRIGGDGYSGVTIHHNHEIDDVALVSDGESSAKHAAVEMVGRAALVRLKDKRAVYYFARQARKLIAPQAVGFEAEEPISIVLQGDSGQIVSPGTEVLFMTARPIRIDGETVAPRASADQTRDQSTQSTAQTIHVPAGTHQISFGR
jgi:hypothetical protein